MVGHGIRSVIGAVDHHHAPLGCRFDVDGIGADAVFDDAFQVFRRLDYFFGNGGVAREDDLGVGGFQGQGILVGALRRHHVGDGSKLIQVLLNDEKFSVGSENLGFQALSPRLSKGGSDGLSLAPASITHFYQGIEGAVWKSQKENP